VFLKSKALFFLILALFGMEGAGWAEGAPPRPFGSDPSDPQELEALLDPIFVSQMEQRHIPGAVIVFVKDGEISFAKGYGWADLEKKTPVSPERTLFRVGSISKLFTATAVMQLAERGAIHLEDDVNRYLKLFRIDSSFPQPVTFAHLLTHTAGFDERAIGIAAPTEADLLPLGEYLARRMPPRVRPPGEQINYSNHGFALLGYLIEAISGISFEAYINRNIFQPLGMMQSSFRLTPELASNLAVGYEFDGGEYRPFPFDYLNVSPAGALLSTGADMAKFIIAHLQDGRLGEERILSEESALEMQRRHFTNDPRLSGVAYGFFEEIRQRRRVLWHNGGWFGFASQLLLLPDERIGLFIAENSLEPGLYLEVTKRFLRNYFPVAEEAEPPLVPFPAQNEVGRFVGHYRHAHYARRTLEKIGTFLDQAEVIDNRDGTFTFASPRDPEEASRWRPVGPLLFERIGEEERIAFREDDRGRVTHLLVGPSLFEKLPWYETAAFHLSVSIGFVTLFSWGAVVWLAGDLLRSPESPPQSPPRTRRLSGLTSLLNLIFLLGAGAAFTRISPREFAYGLPPEVLLLLVIPLLTFGTTAALWISLLSDWRRREGAFVRRLHDSLIGATALGFFPFLVYWNLLGFHF
jgi:CubicO group peptidase (beta-lactamase class C family)